MHASNRVRVDCPDGRKKARQQAQLPLVLGVPAISPRISPMTVNIREMISAEETRFHPGSDPSLVVLSQLSLVHSKPSKVLSIGVKAAACPC